MLRLYSSGSAALHAPRMADASELFPKAAAGADDLLERCKAGEAAAFKELYRRHQRQVASQLAFLVPRADLEDTVQEVFIEVFRSLKKFEGRSAFTTWLYRLTVHVAMKARRRQVRSRLDVVEELPETVDPSAGPSEVTLSAERRARVEELLEKLSPKKRTVLVLHDLRGMEASRIAEVLDTNILTVRTRLFYARRELEQLAAADPALAEFFTPHGREGE
jgi:RNA polymerase sigma-70 factor (ECF subfamily)